MLLQSLLFSVMLITGKSEPYQRFSHLSIEDGLSQSAVYAILQDRQGFMWFGTQDGLNRYDSSNFKVFRHERANADSLSDNLVRVLLEDREGYLWIGTAGGLNRFDPRSNRFTRFRHDPRNPRSLNHDRVLALFQDREGGVWIGTEQGLDRMGLTGDLEHYAVQDDEGHAVGVYAIAEAGHQSLWLGTSRGIYRFDVSGEHFSCIREENPGEALGVITSIVKDRRGTVWFGTGRGAVILRKRADSLGYFPLEKDSNPRVNHILEDGQGCLLFAMDNEGLFRYDPESEALAAITYRPNASAKPGSIIILSLFEDKRGILWVGTPSGIYMIDSTARFQTIRKEDGRTDSLLDNFVLVIEEDSEGSLWIGTEKGLHRRREDGSLTAFPVLETVAGERLEDYSVQAIEERRPGQLWLGIYRSGIFQFDVAAGTLAPLSSVTPCKLSFREPSVRALLQESEDRLWLGTDSEGLIRCNLNNGEVVRYSSGPGKPRRIGHHFIQNIYRAPDGGLWVGTSGGGLSHYLPELDTFETYSHDERDPTSLSHNIVKSVLKDGRGILWVGTSHGLNKGSGQGGFTAYFEEDGLPNDVIYAILADPSDKLWLSTNKGISHFDPEREFCVNYNVADGLQSNEFNTGVATLGRNGTFYFGGVNGLNAFKPHNLKKQFVFSPVVLTAAHIMGEPLDRSRGLSYLSELRLKGMQNVFSLELTQLNFNRVNKGNYAYKMEPLHDGWLALGQNQTITYANLDPGNYTLRVKESGDQDTLTREAYRLKVVVMPPFWKRWWFRLGIVAGFVAGLIWVYRFRIARLMEIERLRARIARDLHDDVGTTLTTITILTELIQEVGDKNRLEKHLGQIRNLTRGLVTTMSDVVWSIDSRYDTLGDLADRMGEFAAKIVGNISYEFHKSGLDMNRKLTPDQRHNLYLVFKEALGNCARHSQATHVQIGLERVGGCLRLRVRDNGKGMESTEGHSGNGLRNMAFRARQLGGHLRLVNENGLMVELSLPGL